MSAELMRPMSIADSEAERNMDSGGKTGRANVAAVVPCKDEPYRGELAGSPAVILPGALASETPSSGRGAEGPSGAPAKHAASVPTLPALSILHEDEYELLRRIEKLEENQANLESVLRIAVEVATRAAERKPICACCAQLDEIAGEAA